MSKNSPLTAEDVEAYSINKLLWREITKQAAAIGLPVEKMKVLDWGAGRGLTVAKLRRLGVPSFGVEIVPEYVRNGQAYLQRQGWTDALSLIDEDCKTKYDDQSFQLVFTQAVLEHVRNLECSIEEMNRVTAVGGVHIHELPAKYHLKECHLFMPCVHWLPKNPLRLWLIYAWILLGREPDWNLTGSRWARARQYYQYSIEKTFYRSEKCLRAVYKKYNYDVVFEELTMEHSFLGIRFTMPWVWFMCCTKRSR